MSFLKFRSALSSLLIVAILVPAAFLARPQSAEAIVVPVNDALVTASNATIALQTTSLTTKEYALDVALTAAKAAIFQAVKQAIFQWAQSGFSGSPAFVENPKDFLKDVADNVAGVMLDDLAGIDICTPFKFDLQLNSINLNIQLTEPDIFDTQAECTLDDFVTGSIDQFHDDFTLGGWDAFIVSLDKQNTPYGAARMAQDRLEEKRAEQKEESINEVQAGSGFQSYKECTSTSPSGYCEHYTIKTPGKTIAVSVDEMISSSLDQLELNDEISEILAGVLAIVIGNVLSSGGLINA